MLVIGGGTMGAGIAHVLAAAGHSVRLVEADEAAAEAARDRLAHVAAREAQRATGTQGTERVPVLVGIPDDTGDSPPVADSAATGSAADGRAAAVELVIEAVYEDEVLKRRVLAEAERRVPPGAILASNTSSLSVGALAASLERPERFIGMHFFNPVPRSALVELVTGPATGEHALAGARRLVRELGKEEIVVRDSPGFATSRLGVAAGLEAIRMLEEGVATAEDIDRGMVLGYRHPMGPLRLTDLVGLDVRLAIAEHLERTLGARFAPPALLRSKVAAGELGKKSGRGFFEW